MDSTLASSLCDSFAEKGEAQKLPPESGGGISLMGLLGVGRDEHAIYGSKMHVEE